VKTELLDLGRRKREERLMGQEEYSLYLGLEALLSRLHLAHGGHHLVVLLQLLGHPLQGLKRFILLFDCFATSRPLFL
jgi:hypothetical protein